MRGPAPAGEAAALQNIRVVLVRPRGSANVGAAARAIKNMGVGQLSLVRPAVRRYKAAEAMAVQRAARYAPRRSRRRLPPQSPIARLRSGRCRGISRQRRVA
jgi:hypothetical protein